MAEGRGFTTRQMTELAVTEGQGPLPVRAPAPVPAP